jgi:hypothetical protein
MAEPPLIVSFGDYSYELQVRYGFGRPLHAGLQRLLEAAREHILATMRAWGPLASGLQRIPREDTGDGTTPFWSNLWFGSLDAVSLYCTLVTHNPATYLEIGSGHSTRFARRAIADHKLRTRIVSIDPQPRADISSLADEIVQRRLEDVDPARFAALTPDDIVFADNSHRSFQNSDVTAFFLDILPQVPSGALVHLHDIFLPLDYPSDWRKRLYNEQYLLAVALLFGQAHFAVEFPSAFVGVDPALAEAANALFSAGPLADRPLSGGSFWLRVR